MFTMWTILFLCLAIIFLGVIWVLNRKDVKLTWYEWLIGSLGILILGFAVQNFFGSFSEAEPKAAWTFAWVFGIPALVLIALAWQLAARRVKRA
ncbi:reductive dehalogenase anchoring protein [Dehalococcoides mccartyi VS]|uniref:Reductive dehalogenase anchoring protein n=2 Tax=Dehalococcoides mccartyi TaxID=61435 RepID=D2BJC5_DEHMV|nr:reductive dehalogenase anchoring protein [Dehalococcoides mccartyi VS]